MNQQQQDCRTIKAKAPKTVSEQLSAHAVLESYLRSVRQHDRRISYTEES